jgi:uncharacterized protein (DUF433 family)
MKMKEYERIEINPNIMFGKPVIINTRITVEQILRKLAGGMTIEEIIEDHPHLKREDILAALDLYYCFDLCPMPCNYNPHALLPPSLPASSH